MNVAILQDGAPASSTPNTHHTTTEDDSIMKHSIVSSRLQLAANSCTSNRDDGATTMTTQKTEETILTTTSGLGTKNHPPTTTTDPTQGRKRTLEAVISTDNDDNDNDDDNGSHQETLAVVHDPMTMTTTTTAPSIMSTTKKDTITNTIAQTLTKTSTSPPSLSCLTPMTLANLGTAVAQSRRRGQNSATTATSPRFSRRTASCPEAIGSMPASATANGVATAVHHKEESDLGYHSGEDLGYNTNDPALGYGDDATSISKPPPSLMRPAKRQCRYQRRNSFVIPETSSCTPGQLPSSQFSWKAVEFLYGHRRTAASVGCDENDKDGVIRGDGVVEPSTELLYRRLSSTSMPPPAPVLEATTAAAAAGAAKPSAL